MYAEEGSAGCADGRSPLHPELLARLDIEYVTLHVGLDTFRPVAVDDLAEHTMHGERYAVRPQTWTDSRRRPRAGRRHDDGSRAFRVDRARGPLEGRTSPFITPGFQFQRVDRLADELPPAPRSTLLALVMAFAGT